MMTESEIYTTAARLWILEAAKAGEATDDDLGAIWFLLDRRDQAKRTEEEVDEHTV